MNAVWLNATLAWERTPNVARVLAFAGLLACLMGWSLFDQARIVQADRTRLAAVKAELVRSRAVAKSPDAPVVETSAADRFRDALGSSTHVEQHLKSIFDAARENGLDLLQAQYKSGRGNGGVFQTYQVELPLNGSYPAVRRFCEQVLLDVPFAALEEIRFKRDSAAQAKVQATMRFVLYLDDSTQLGILSGLDAEASR